MGVYAKYFVNFALLVLIKQVIPLEALLVAGS